MNSRLIIIVLVTGLLLAGGVITALVMYNKTDADLTKTEPHFVMSPADLYSEFSSDEASATSRYAGKVIELSGEVSAVEKGSGSNGSIHLATGDFMGDIICTMADGIDIEDVKVGQQLTVRGECSGMLMDVLLNNGVVIGVPPTALR